MIPMSFTPSKFFITSGYATSPISDLNAFDLALLKAQISEQNLVAVSSVIPVGAEEVEVRELPMGAVTFCVLSQMRGRSGDSLKEELSRKMKEMSRIRGVEFGEIHYRIEELQVPQDEYGCCISALVFAEYRD